MIYQNSTCDFPVCFKDNGYEYSGIAKRISKNGLFIETNRDVEMNSTIDLEFIQPRTTIPIKIGANVIHKDNVTADTFGIEVKFNLVE